MEFRDFLNLMKKHLVIFWLIFLGVVVIGLVIYNQQNKLYLGSIAINITREGSLNSNKDYQYDQFYRLQADEKFGKNIINWVGDPGLMAISRKEFKKLKKGKWEDIFKIKTTQLSANYVKVDFKSKTSKSAVVFGEALKKSLNNKNQQLNTGQNKNNWFKLIIEDTQVAKNNINIFFVLLVLSCFGILLGVFGVLVKYYFNFSENENRN